MEENKKGRKPLKDKATLEDAFLTEDNIFGNALAIPPNIQEELAEKGLVGRWISADTVYKNQGYHPKGWRVYKSKSATMGSEWKNGSDPEGVIRRGANILGVKTKEEVAQHKALLRKKAQRQSLKASDREAAKTLRASVAESGLSTKVVEGGADDE